MPARVFVPGQLDQAYVVAFGDPSSQICGLLIGAVRTLQPGVTSACDVVAF
jgi:hypothetical protein